MTDRAAPFKVVSLEEIESDIASEIAAFQRELLDRIAGSLAVPPHLLEPPMPTTEDMLRADCEADPFDDSRWLILADYLEDEGRGEEAARLRADVTRRVEYTWGGLYPERASATLLVTLKDRKVPLPAAIQLPAAAQFRAAAQFHYDILTATVSVSAAANNALADAGRYGVWEFRVENCILHNSAGVNFQRQ